MTTSKINAVTSYADFAAYADKRPKTAPLFRRIVLAFEAAKQRRSLAGLDAHLLADIGVNAANARAESRRHGWDVPANWLK